MKKKRKLRKALAEGKPIPTELRKEEPELMKEIILEDSKHQIPQTHIDDEYSRCGIIDPKILLTTSREPSSRLLQFAKEISLIIPNCTRTNRGKHIMKELVDICRENEVTDLIIIHEHRGEPNGMVICHLPYGPTAYFGLYNVVLRHDIQTKETISQQYPHLIFDNFTTKLGERVQNILKYLFPVPKEDSKRVLTFANQHDFISFRHHIFKKDKTEILLKEIGPRFEMRLYQIKLGTIDIEIADNEWVYKPYLNSSKLKDYL
jgi:U3 small nucleolar ribonucleoprotein protein IMP4